MFHVILTMRFSGFSSTAPTAPSRLQRPVRGEVVLHGRLQGASAGGDVRWDTPTQMGHGICTLVSNWICNWTYND